MNAPTPVAADGAERLRHFCDAVLGWLDAGGERADGLVGALAGAIGTGTAGLADGLAREAAAYETAVRDLQALLPATILAPPPAVVALIDELAARRELAVRVVAAVRHLGPGPDAEARAAVADRGRQPLTDWPREPAPKWPARGASGKDWRPQIGDEVYQTVSPSDSLRESATSGLTRSPAASPEPEAEARAADADTILDHSAPHVRDTELAADLYQQAVDLQRSGDFHAAAETYALALQADQHFGPAWSRRGQVRLALGDVTGAIADLSSALELDDTAVEASWWRGDAHAVAGRTDVAIADYERALALKPDLTRARFNLAVALRLRGDHRRARAELDRVLAEQPGHTGAHLNRGLIHLHNGERELAAEEFRATLHHDPKCDTARRHLAEVVPPARPAPAAPERKEVGHLVVECPRCGEAGEVPLDRLGKVFECARCKGRFGVRPDGSVAELVNTREGRWVDAPKARASVRRKRRRRLLAAAVAVLFVLPAAGLGGWRAVRTPPLPTEPELPKELAARAELFGKAWAANDQRTMRRLTSPADERSVYPWYLKHSPPPALRGRPTEPATVVSTKPVQPDVTAVRVRVPGPSPAELALTWQQRGDTWYFVPGR